MRALPRIQPTRIQVGSYSWPSIGGVSVCPAMHFSKGSINLQLAYFAVGLLCCWLTLLLAYFAVGLLCSWLTLLLGYFALGLLRSWLTLQLAYFAVGLLCSWLTLLLAYCSYLMRRKDGEEDGVHSKNKNPIQTIWGIIGKPLNNP